MKQGLSLTAMAQELERQKTTKKDLVVDTSNIQLAVFEAAEAVVTEENYKTPAPRLIFTEDTGDDTLDALDGIQVNHIAHRQIGERVKIPAKYYERMLEEQPRLLAENVNTWFRSNPERRMVRTLDGNARAFMSDRYARIDNYDVANTVMPILHEEMNTGMEIVSCDVTERKMYIKCTTPRLTAEIKGSPLRVNDIVQGGIEISNSEVGFGAVIVRPLIYQLWCTNGCTTDIGGYRRAHLGGRAQGEDEIVHMLSDETLRADDNAIMLKVQDVLKGFLKEGVFEGIVERMQETVERKIEGNPVKAMEVLGATVGLTQGESDDCLKHLIEGADMSQYGLMNAVTRMSQDVDSYDRATEMEAMGGKILDLSPANWKLVSEAA